jgi:hypothetical protein
VGEYGFWSVLSAMACCQQLSLEMLIAMTARRPDGRQQHGLSADQENDTRHIGRRHWRGRHAAKAADALQLSFIVLVFAINPVPHGDRLDAAPHGDGSASPRFIDSKRVATRLSTE